MALKSKLKERKHYTVLRVQGTTGTDTLVLRVHGTETMREATIRCFKKVRQRTVPCLTVSKVSGGNDGEDTPVPIPNTEVKLSSADDTWAETPRESRSLPDLYESLMVITP